MHRYEVGQPYVAGRTSWPEMAEYTWRGQHELRMFFRNPSRDEVDAIRLGSAEFAVVEEQPVLLLLYRFGQRIPWSDAPFSALLLPEPEQIAPPELGEAGRALLHVVLVDAATGLIQALRAISLSPRMSHELHAAIRRQLEIPWDPAVFDATLASLYAQYPSSERLLLRALARSR